ncbi:hypothetical protein J6P92_00270 [bacterium]|nr:hypothetical protein [bacterium]
MSVHQLSSSYVATLSENQIQGMLRNDVIVKRGDKYYVHEKNVKIFANRPDAFEVDDAKKPKEYQFGVKGAIVERTTTDQQCKVVRQEIKHYVSLNEIMDVLKLDAAKQQEFIQFLKDKGYQADDEGLLEKSNALLTELDNFQEEHKEYFEEKGVQYIEFTADTDPEAIKELSTAEKDAKPAITTDQQTGRHVVTNRAALDEAMPEVVEGPELKKSTPRSVNLNVVTVTKTERQRELNVPDNLADNKDARKKLEADARELYTQFAANPKNRDAVDLYVAESKYEKQINKREQELLEMKTVDGKKTKRNASDIVNLYLNEYSNPEQAKIFREIADIFAESEDEEDQAWLLDVCNRHFKMFGGDVKKISDLPKDTRYQVALVAEAEANGLEPKDLLRLMAMQDVMGSRTTQEIADDDAYFIKHQAEDYVKNQQAQQEFPNTNINLENMGKHGRKLVDQCPEFFGDAISKEDYDNGMANDKNNYYSAVVTDRNGQKEEKYFKFNNDVWNTFMKVACDPTSATANDKRLLESHNMTLQEGRTGLEMQIPTKDGGRPEEIRKIIGNSNDATGNRELNRWRELVEQTGLSVDSNPTAAKRLWHVVKNAGIGAGMGLLSGGISSLFGATVAFAGQTAAQTVPYLTHTEGKWVDYHGETEGGYQNFDIEIEGRQVTVDFTTPDQNVKVSHNVNVDLSALGQENLTVKWTGYVQVDGQTYPVTATIDPETQTRQLWVNGQEYNGKVWVDGEEVKGEVEAKGQDYDGKTNNTREQLRNATILGGIAGAARGLATMNKVDAKGRNTDDVYDPTYMDPETSTETSKEGIQVNQYSRVEKRSGNMGGGRAEEFKAVKNQGPAAYSIMYQYEDGTAVSPGDFAKAYKERIGGQMTNRNFYAFTDLQVNGRPIVLRSDYKAQYEKVPEGDAGEITGVNYANNAQQRYVAGTIRGRQ